VTKWTRRAMIVAPLTAGLFYLSGLAVFDRVFGPGGPRVSHYENLKQAELPPDQIETVFVALDVTRVDVPVERLGGGGALTSAGDALILVTYEGHFFEVGGDEAVRLDIAAPPNGWAAMLAFEEANPDYKFAHFYFRFNDIDVHDGRIIVSYTEWVADGDCYRTALASAAFDPADVNSATIAESDWSVFFVTDPCLAPNTSGTAIQGHQAGGRFRIGDDGLVYLTSGDYAIDGIYAPNAVSQEPDQLYGKVIAIDPDTGDWRVISQGHSNAQGIAFDPEGRLWSVEHGRRGGDELNLIEEGVDYGWPQVSLGTRYNRLPLPNTLDYGRHPVFQPPVHAWLPSVAISSLALIDDFHPAWDGDLLAGSLAGRSLFRIRLIGEQLQFAERIEIGERIRYVEQHGDAIALWTDGWQVMQLRLGEFDPSYLFAVSKVKELPVENHEAEAVTLALESCSQCHGFGVLPGAAAPPLGEVFGRDVASYRSFDYSSALNAVRGQWDHDRLVAYISNTEAVAAGTSMPNPGIDDPVVVAAIVDILQALREQAE